MLNEWSTLIEKRIGEAIHLECYHFWRKDVQLGKDNVTVIVRGARDQIVMLFRHRIDTLINDKRLRKAFVATEHFCADLQPSENFQPEPIHLEFDRP